MNVLHFLLKNFVVSTKTPEENEAPMIVYEETLALAITEKYKTWIRK